MSYSLEFNVGSLTAEEEYRIKGYIEENAEECLETIIELEEVKEALESTLYNTRKASGWLLNWLELPDDEKLDGKSLDIITTVLNTLLDVNSPD